MTGKLVEIRLRLGNRRLTALERRLLVNAFVNGFDLVVGGSPGKERPAIDSEQEPVVIKLIVPPYHDNSRISEQLLLLAKNCGAEIDGPVSITPIDESPPQPSGFFA